MGNFVSSVGAFLARYRKGIIAAAAGLAVVVNETAGGGSVRWVDVVAAVAGALGVYLIPNTPASSPPAAKA